jgi:hypothetical protein
MTQQDNRSLVESWLTDAKLDPAAEAKIRGRENMRAFQEHYPNPPQIKVRRTSCSSTG